MSREAEKDPVLYSDWLTLLGFLGETEALQHIQGQAVIPLTSPDEWIEKIRIARQTVANISGRLKVQPEVKELGHEFDERISQLQADPTFAEHIAGMKSSRFALVELAKIHCFQLNLNTEYVDSLVEKAPEPQDLAEAVKFCLPLREEKPKTQVLSSFNPNTNTFSSVTQNLDLRITGNLQGEDQVTHRPFAGFIYSFGLPQVSVVEYKGMFLMRNGHHRAYALLKKGHTFLPCVLLSTDSYQTTGGQAPGFLPFDLMLSDRSPIMADFMTEAAVLIPRRRLRVMVSIHAEVQLVPM